MTVEDLARICNSANAAYCLTLGETHQKPWEELPEHHKESIIEGVNLHLDKPKASPGDSHNSWFNFKMEHGWSYGPEIDAEAKTHPCMVPFDQLPADQAAKDHLFKAICNTLAPFVERDEPSEE